MSSESKVKNECFLIAGELGLIIIRMQSGTFKTIDNRFVKMGVPGLADSLLIKPIKITHEMVGTTLGLAVFPELKKTKGGVQSQEQKAFELAVKKQGAVYALINSVYDFYELLK